MVQLSHLYMTPGKTICVCMSKYIHCIFSIHSSVDGHLNYFHILAVINRATTNVCEYLFESLVLNILYLDL